ncbi:MAG: hypothetical protein HN732_14065, partial [Rhodospirillaceae bacterium]|nr:hypothetical protein [Rhodospirillaceae bacterium]
KMKEDGTQVEMLFKSDPVEGGDAGYSGNVYWGTMHIDIAEGEMIETLKIGDQELNFADVMAEHARITPADVSSPTLALSDHQLDQMEDLLDQAMAGPGSHHNSTLESTFVETASLVGGEDPWEGDDIA